MKIQSTMYLGIPTASPQLPQWRKLSDRSLTKGLHCSEDVHKWNKPEYPGGGWSSKWSHGKSSVSKSCEQKDREADWGSLEHGVGSGRVQRNVQGNVGGWAGSATSWDISQPWLHHNITLGIIYPIPSPSPATFQGFLPLWGSRVRTAFE